MIILERNSLEKISLPGRAIQKAVGKDSFSSSVKMTMGFSNYSAASGPMEPHQHAEEIVYILKSEQGWIRQGPAADKLGERLMLKEGMTCHIPELEWHVFEFDEGGSIDIIYFYGQVDNIRPEDMK